MGQTGEVADDHAEAVVEGHRYGDPVVVGVLEHIADVVAIVDDVVVGEGGGLGSPSGARGELYVGGVLEFHCSGALVVFLALPAVQFVEVQHAPVLLVSDQNHVLQVGQALQTQTGGGLRAQVRVDLREQLDVVAALEAWGHYECGDLHLVEGVLQFYLLVGRVDVYQDQVGE